MGGGGGFNLNAAESRMNRKILNYWLKIFVQGVFRQSIGAANVS